ncbi:MAG: preprotein translocase subunit YajC [Spirochaetia bacterium]
MNAFLNNLPTLIGAPEAGAGAGAGASGSGQLVSTIVIFGLVFLIFYFLIIRPQNKKQKETKKMLEALKKGDRVVTIGGIHGTINSIKGDRIILKIDGNTKMEFSRSAISGVVEQSAPQKAEKQIEEKEEETDSEAEKTEE